MTVIEYFVPMYFTKLTGGSRHAERGAMVGSFLGFITGTGLKTIVSVILMWKIIVFAF